MTVSKTIKVKQGSKLEWIVRADGFEEQSGVIDVVTENTEFPIYLIGNTNNTATLSFNYTPEDATVMINDVVGNNQKIRKGLTATWEVSANRYYSQSGTTDRMYDNLEIPVDLVGPHVILSIKTNKDVYTVKINGVEGNNQWVLKGTKATYSVELYGYETITGTTDELYEDTTLDFTMRKAPYDLKDATYWSSSSSEFSGFSIPGGYAAWDYWTMNLNRRAFLASAEANTNYWNDSYYGVIDIHFKNGSSWLSRSRNNDTITYTSTTVNEKSSGSGYRYRKYKNIGICNPYRELSHVYFDHWHFSSKGDIDTSASLTSLLGYWANTLTINTNIPATITVDGVTKTDVTTYDFYTLDDEIDNTREIAYSIEAEGYMPQSGTLVLDKDVTLDIVLEELYPVTFTINPTPAESTVIINGEERNTIEIMQLEEVNWSVTYDGYASQTGSFIIYEDTLLEPTLDVEFGLWESSTPGTYDVEVKIPGQYQLTLVGGGGGSSGYCFTNGSDYPIVTLGGGAGYIQNHTVLLDVGTYTVVVGEGGAGKYGNPTSTSGNYYYAVAGGNSSISNSTYSAVAYGGHASSVYGSSTLQDTVQLASSSSPSTSTFPVVTEGTFGIGQAGEEHWGRTWSSKSYSGKPGLTVNGANYGYSGRCSVYYFSGEHSVSAGDGSDGYVSIEWKGFE